MIRTSIDWNLIAGLIALLAASIAACKFMPVKGPDQESTGTAATGCIP
jgi:hypothetical protein